MSLEPYPNDEGLSTGWREMGAGAPTLIALAQLCSQAIVRGADHETPLSPEAEAILFAAQERGVIDVKGANTAFESPSRMLAIYVELDEERTLVFRSKTQPAITVRFFDGFRELCAAGLVMHHLYRDFSLSRAGFARAERIPREQVAAQLALATEFGLHD